jgi:hypothetical protein
MKSILIRDIDPDILDALKRLAKMHNRSLQGELHEIVERAAERAPSAEAEPPFEIVTVHTSGQSSWSREEIYGDKGR